MQGVQVSCLLGSACLESGIPAFGQGSARSVFDQVPIFGQHDTATADKVQPGRDNVSFIPIPRCKKQLILLLKSKAVRDKKTSEDKDGVTIVVVGFC